MWTSVNVHGHLSFFRVNGLVILRPPLFPQVPLHILGKSWGRFVGEHPYGPHSQRHKPGN